MLGRTYHPFYRVSAPNHCKPITQWLLASRLFPSQLSDCRFSRSIGSTSCSCVLGAAGSCGTSLGPCWLIIRCDQCLPGCFRAAGYSSRCEYPMPEGKTPFAQCYEAARYGLFDDVRPGWSEFEPLPGAYDQNCSEIRFWFL